MLTVFCFIVSPANEKNLDIQISFADVEVNVHPLPTKLPDFRVIFPI